MIERVTEATRDVALVLLLLVILWLWLRTRLRENRRGPRKSHEQRILQVERDLRELDGRVQPLYRYLGVGSGLPPHSGLGASLGSRVLQLEQRVESLAVQVRTVSQRSELHVKAAPDESIVPESRADVEEPPQGSPPAVEPLDKARLRIAWDRWKALRRPDIRALQEVLVGMGADCQTEWLRERAIALIVDRTSRETFVVPTPYYIYSPAEDRRWFSPEGGTDSGYFVDLLCPAIGEQQDDRSWLPKHQGSVRLAKSD